MPGKKKTNMEILNEIRALRNSQLEKMDDNSVSVIKVEVLGKEENGKVIFRLIEEKNIENTGNGEFKKEFSELFYEYDEEPRLIARLLTLPRSSEREIIMETNGSFDKLSEQKGEIERCLRERAIEIRKLATEIGISQDKINKLSSIELEREIMSKGGIKLKEDEKEEKTEKNKEEKKDEDIQTIDENKVYSLSGMNEVNLDAPIDTKGNTLGKELGLEDYSKIIVVHAYKLNELIDSNGNKGNRENIKFGFVGKRKDGTYETISKDKISMYRGAKKSITTITDDVEDQEVETRSNDDYVFNTSKDNKKLVIRQNDPYGIPEIYLVKSDRTNEAMIGQELQDKYDGTQKTEVKVRELFNPNKGIYYTNRQVKETEEHAGDAEGPKDVDGEPNTAKHLHINSVVYFEGREAKFYMIAKAEGDCETEEEINELLDLTNTMLAKNNGENVEQAIKSAIEERNNTLIQQSPDPQKVKDVMREANIKNPKPVIEALNKVGWEQEDAVKLAKGSLGRSRGEPVNQEGE